MSIALYMDHHVPSAVTYGLRLRGVDVLTAEEDGTQRLADPDLLDRATAVGRALFSQDVDLIREAAARQRQGLPFAGVIAARQGHTTIGQIVADLEFIAKAGDSADLENTVVYLPL